MSTITLFDTLAHVDLGPSVSELETLPLKALLARDLIVSSLTDLRRIHEYEAMLLRASVGVPLAPTLRETVWRLLSGWAEEAAQVAVRTHSLDFRDSEFPELLQLDNAIGSTRARLNVTPAQIANALDQVKQGLTIPAKELRDELRTRVRA